MSEVGKTTRPPLREVQRVGPLRNEERPRGRQEEGSTDDEDADSSDAASQSPDDEHGSIDEYV